MLFSQTNTANTISINFSPGQDFRDFPVRNRSIFTFGDYRITQSSDSSVVSEDASQLLFDGYETLDSLQVSGYTQNPSVFVSSRELNLKKTDPNNYAYFQTLKLDIATSIDKIISTQPYAIASIVKEISGVTGYDYSAVTTGPNAQYSTIKIPFSSITNQGGVILNSGSTITGRSLMLNTQDYIVQLSGSSNNQNPQHIISAYTFSAGTYLEFTFETILLTGQTSGTTTLPIWIRPTNKVLKNWHQSLTPLEYHLIKNGSWKLKDPDFNNGTYMSETYLWPKTIDGFNYDTYGSVYDLYLNNVLHLAEQIDCDKTDIMMRTMVPENFLELDTQNSLYRNTIQSFAHQFDHIKRYIDGIAFAHTVDYTADNSVPDKFIIKLSELLGWKLTSGFSELDLFEYLTTDVGSTESSKKAYDMEVWRRIMVNLIWMFKRKGTRDALQFIFKLIGAPDCIIRLEEFVYDIKTAIITGQTGNLLTNQLTNKINDNGYVDYSSSQYIFQEGGKGRGNGDRYIRQWTPEFDPIARVDNFKTYSGNTVFFGTENVINSKELIAGLDPAQAIECDLHSYYQQSGTCWVWGSQDPFQFQNLNVPFEYTINDCSLVNPESISGMTFQEWSDFIYKSNIDPRTRKTTSPHNGGFHYHNLRKIYIHYYRMTSPESNKINFGKLQRFLELIEAQFYCAAEQLIPATSILEAFGTIYRNTVFNRQKYVYPTGINRGSEFQLPLPISPKNQLFPIKVDNTVNDIISMTGTPISSSFHIIAEIPMCLNMIHIDMGANVNLVQQQLNGFNIEMEVEDFVEDSEIIG